MKIVRNRFLVVVSAIYISLFFAQEGRAACKAKAPPEIKNTNPNLIPSNNRVFKVAPTLYEQINRVQKKVGGPVRVTSGWRDCASNSSARGMPNSTHLHGKALDSNLQAGNVPRCNSYLKTVQSVKMPQVGVISECRRSGYSPHVHLQTGSLGPCKNCNAKEPVNYKRTDQEKKGADPEKKVAETEESEPPAKTEPEETKVASEPASKSGSAKSGSAASERRKPPKHSRRPYRPNHTNFRRYLEPNWMDRVFNNGN